MSTDTCIVSILPDKIKVKIDGKSREQIRTPFKIAHEMVEVVCRSIPDDKWNKDLKILDFYCKSGVFLKIFADKLFEKTRHLYNNDKECMEHILKHQLFGIAADKLSRALATRALYGSLVSNSNIKYIEHFEDLVKLANPKLFYDRIKETFSEVYSNIEIIDKEGNYNMKGFGVVIGNPPYNNDAYLDFVDKGHKLSSNLTCMITPAKWQAKGGEKNEAFRRDIVPYMEEITYYPDCTDVFEIGDPGGISIFIIDKKEHNIKKIHNISNKHKNSGKTFYNDDVTRSFDNYCLYNFGEELVNKIFTNNIKPIKIEDMPKQGRYNIYSANKVSLVSNIPKTYLWSSDGVFNCLGLQQIIDTSEGDKKYHKVPEDSRLIFASDSLDECKSFVSWVYTRFVRYMLSLSLCGLTGIATNNEWWRFVPAPEAFDHIFTDDELYKKYNITEEEQNIIESVIKERK